MISIIPILIVFISFIFRTEKINFSQVLGLILSITGVAIIVTRLDLAKLINLDLNKGDLWLLVAMLSWAIYSTCLLYTSPSPRDRQKSRMPSSA